MHLWPELSTHKNQTLRYELELNVPTVEGMLPHRALPDALVTATLLQKMLEQKKQSVMLVPEIALTPQIIERFSQKFKVAVYHSKQTPKERRIAWNQSISIVYVGREWQTNKKGASN